MRVAGRIDIDESELEEQFIRASGPGGQNVNKVASAVQLRFDARRSRALTPDIYARLEQLAGRRMTQDGVIIITAQRYRTQEGNRRDARARLADLITRACEPVRPRRATRPTRASKERRIESKSRRGTLKTTRARVRRESDDTV